MKYLVGVITGRLARMDGIKILHTETVEIASSNQSGVYVQVDGEFAGRLPAKLSMVPNALTLLVPREFERKHQHG